MSAHVDNVEVKGCQESILYPPWVPGMELGSSYPAWQGLLPLSYSASPFYTWIPAKVSIGVGDARLHAINYQLCSPNILETSVRTKKPSPGCQR